MANEAKVTLNYPDLVSWLTDFERLSMLPLPGERTAMASSYDRASRYDPVQDRYLDWGANTDGDGIVRREEGGDVLVELIGPGAVVRIWMATVRPGHLKLFVDGDETPVLDAPFASFFDASLPFFAWPNLVYAGNGVATLNNYVPIPFEHSLKVVAAPQSGGYFQITYVQFPEAQIASLGLPLSSEDLSALAMANHRLDRPGRGDAIAVAGAMPPVPGTTRMAGIELVSFEDQGAISNANHRRNRSGLDDLERGAGTSVVEIDVVAVAGAGQLVLDIAGPAAIEHLRISLDLPTDIVAQRRLLRELVIRVTWDDEAEPAIWSPLGDFFGYFGGARPFEAFPMGVGADGVFYSDWYMPFATRARLEIVNDGGHAVPIRCEVTTGPLALPVGAYGRFHAKWHRDAFLPDRRDREPDWTILTTQGRGRYVGLHLHVWNPGGDWWGEGDEKFFVDGEKFPSEFGTGSEDYFGYAWGSPGLFSRPFHNQILNEDNAGHIVVNRWHFADSVPFQVSFEGCIEKYFPNDRPTLYAVVPYWYLAPEGRDPYGSASLADRIDYWAGSESSDGDIRQARVPE